MSAAPAPRPPRDRINDLPLPRARGWLIAILPEPDRLRHLLACTFATDEMQHLFRAEPARFARVFRPLCHALGIDMPAPLPAPPPPTRHARPRLDRAVLAESGADAPPAPGVPPSLRHYLFQKT